MNGVQLEVYTNYDKLNDDIGAGNKVKTYVH